MANPFRCPVALLSLQDPPTLRRWVRHYWARVSFSMVAGSPVNGSRAVEIFDEFAKATTPLQVSTAMENLISRPWVRQFCVDVGLSNSQPDVPLWVWASVSSQLAGKLTTLNEQTVAFNSSIRALGYVGERGTSGTLRRLLENAHTQEFHEAFDDSQIPSSIRLAYLSHQYLPLYLFILWGLHHKMVNTYATAAILVEMEAAVDRSLGLALALNNSRMSAFQADSLVSPIVLLDEINLWREYLANTEK